VVLSPASGSGLDHSLTSSPSPQAPYSLSISTGGLYLPSQQLETHPNLNDPTYGWTVTQPSGTGMYFQITDANGAVGYVQNVFVGESGDASCLSASQQAAAPGSSSVEQKGESSTSSSVVAVASRCVSVSKRGGRVGGGGWSADSIWLKFALVPLTFALIDNHHHPTTHPTSPLLVPYPLQRIHSGFIFDRGRCRIHFVCRRCRPHHLGLTHHLGRTRCRSCRRSNHLIFPFTQQQPRFLPLQLVQRRWSCCRRTRRHRHLDLSSPGCSSQLVQQWWW
jgi:hypothetical protein